MTAAEFKAARDLLGLSVATLAERSSVSVTTIRRFERGERVRGRHVATLRSAVEAAGARVVDAGLKVGGRVVEGGVVLVRAVGP